MDDIVERAMRRWPNVPAVYGWLRLDRRGIWWIRLSETEPDRFDRITGEPLIAYINRNYARDERGAYFFQNGPQRVFVTLDYTPYVFRLSDDETTLVAHTDIRIQTLRAAFFDDEGQLLLDTNLGAGVLLDRDLAKVVDANGEVALPGLSGPVGKIASNEVAQRFGFIAHPTAD